MKNLFMITLITMVSIISFGQKVKEKNVPSIIKNALYQKQVNAKGVKWDKENNNYEASFDLNKIQHSILFDANGKIIETEMEIEISKLPKNTTVYLSKQYPNKKIKEVAKIIDVNNTTTYEVEINAKDLIFDTNGNFIKETKD